MLQGIGPIAARCCNRTGALLPHDVPLPKDTLLPNDAPLASCRLKQPLAPL